jgi:2-keto-4-pentenoate hydratase/2-oxohepta-3-ene-1,7-dioic acid hydratase in catechol pathway
MKLASFRVGGVDTWGLIDGSQAIDLGSVLQTTFPDLRSALARLDRRALQSAASGAPRLSLEAVEWLPVITHPRRILCVGMNYEMHRLETGRPAGEFPTIFTRFASSQTGHRTDILRPRVSTRLDYEAELAVVIGAPGRYIERAAAWDHVAGFSCYNDGSVRDWQRHSSQFTPGKNFPCTGAFGPWLVTPDELGKLGPQRIRSRLNGKVMQESTLGDMIFDVPRLIEYCSSFTPLEPGDVIATGTPGGVGDKRDPPVFMKPGDVIEVEIDGIGTLVNSIADDTAG